MKRMIVLLLCILLLASLCACRNKNADIKDPVSFYYCRQEVIYHVSDAVICAQIRDGADFNGDPEQMLHSYLDGPHANGYVAPFPADTKLISFQIANNNAYVILSDEFSKLTGIKLTTACSCIALTLCEYSNVDSVHISAETQQLDYKNEIVIKASDIVLLDNEGKD